MPDKTVIEEYKTLKGRVRRIREGLSSEVEMQAVVLKNFGGPENLARQEIPLPDVHSHEVLIEVKAISINPVDIKTRRGEAQARFFRNEHPMVLGWDVSGVVNRVGTKVKEYKKGDEVFGTIRFPGCGRAYARYVAAPVTHVSLKPGNVTHEEAAAATLAALTAWKAIVTYGRVEAGQRVLVHGGAGGVGYYAVQLAKYFGAYVVATASGRNRSLVMEAGSDEFVDYTAQRFEEVAKDMDLVIDPVGGENFARSLTVLRPEGIIIHLPSNKAEEASVLAQKKHIKGFYQMQVESSGENMRYIAGLLEQGRLKSHIFRIFSFEQLAEAHRQLESGMTAGKIVVTL